jgi:hypothetical protein
MFLTISYQRLFLRSSILSGYSLKISSTSSHSSNKRHRISSPPLHHLPHRIHSNKTSNQPNTIRRLFQPIDVKPIVATDKFDSISTKDSNTNIGQELTGGKTLERSMKTRNFIFY